EIEKWRDMLARNIALRNPRLSTRELNFAVQRTIDRLIFLRICEDRGIEHYAFLQSLLNGERVYPRLVKHFRDADDRYNSGLFHFRAGRRDMTEMSDISDRVPSHNREPQRTEPPDLLTLDLTIDDKPLKEIIGSLYYPDCPYEFSVLPADILGQVYEQFLGKVIRLTAGHQAKVEEKPEVRKAGGVYYTPTYIVDYIVKNTVGKLVEGKTPKQVEALRILDPACGSGSFLLGAYQFLLDWHLEYYLKQKPQTSSRKPQAPVYQDRTGNWKLTTSERKRILLNNIYGVDIDSQAVEVTKLSLLLKVLEGENQETLQNQLKFFHERALPDLGSNIKCGNSLIGPDFYQNQQSSLFDQEEQYRINVFDWNAAFPDIMKSGGFDAVIGNPPYVRIQNLREEQPREVSYYEDAYTAAVGKYDLYALFLEKSTQLLRANGRLGMIIPNKFLISDYGSGIRGHLAEKGSVSELVSFQQLQVFEQASIYTCILLWSRERKRRMDYVEFSSLDNVANDLSDLAGAVASGRASRAALAVPKGDGVWHLTADAAAHVVLGLPDRWSTFDKVTDRVFQGIITGGDKLFIFEDVKKGGDAWTVHSRQFDRDFRIEKSLLRPFLRGSSIKRYFVTGIDSYILYPYKADGDSTVFYTESELTRQFPLAWRYLQFAKSEMSARGSARMEYQTWYALWCPRDIHLLTGPKLLVPTIALAPSFALDAKGEFFFLGSGAGGPGAYGLTFKEHGVDPLYALGILNSRVTDIHVRATSSVFQGGYRAYSQQFLTTIPFRPIDFANKADKARHDKMVELVERMLDLHKQLPKAKTPHEQESLKRTIAATDSQIDGLVYELYGLTEDEIRIVEQT
ncbi:MAG: N-6 DNA methylase, partial [Armatimonadetes bacterium]|nr:N-6 DNA methylase [Armatimonadota bacterium]